MCGEIRNINYEGLCNILKNNVNVVLIDTRSPQEYAENRINNAINIPEYDIARNAELMLPNRSALIILYCQSGDRSKKAYRILEKMGYTNLYNLRGGLNNI